MAEIKESFRCLQVPPRYPRNTVAKLMYDMLHRLYFPRHLTEYIGLNFV
jgi:hypothetical protein